MVSPLFINRGIIMEKRINIIKLSVVLISALVLAAVDQVIKYFVVEYLEPVGSVVAIPNLLTLVYVRNEGAAFGIFQGAVVVFSLLTVAMIGVFIYLILAKKLKGKLFYISTALIIGGGIGNLIDRLFRHFVVDYLQLSFFPPVCNFADYCVTIGAALFIISLLFINSKDIANDSRTSADEKTDSGALDEGDKTED